MVDAERNEVRVRAYSPGRYPILVVEISPGQLRTLYYETSYDLDRAKTVEENWLNENALGRHSFVELDPARDLAPADIPDYVHRELLGES